MTAIPEDKLLPAGSHAAARVGGRPSVGRLVMRRLLLTPVILLGVATAVFLLFELSPKDPALAALGIQADAADRAQFAAQHGLDDPVLVRFGRFIADTLTLNLGDSIIRPEPVTDLIQTAFPVTLQLMLLATLFAVLSSLTLGIVAAQFEGRLVDRLISGFAATLQASPPFWTGLLFIQLFAVGLGVLPAGGYTPLEAGFSYWFSSLVGPAVVLSLPFSAAMTRVIRASIADELTKDYVRTATGAGLPQSKLLFVNVLRNALTTPVTVLGVYIGTLMSGAVVVEVVFNLPGLGSLLMSGVAGDLAIVRGVALIGAASFVLVNLLVDIAYLFLNPRSVEVQAK